MTIHLQVDSKIIAHILKNLNDVQAYAASLGKGPILVIAGAGSGKTRTLVHRVAFLTAIGVAPSTILLLTFTRRAAVEMISRARKLVSNCAGIEGWTFHSFCYRLLKQYGNHVGLSHNFTVIDRIDTEQILRDIIKKQALKTREDKRFPKVSTIADLISKSRNLEQNLHEIIEEQSKHLEIYIRTIFNIVQAYNQLKYDQMLLDYDDLLSFAELLLKDNSQVRRELIKRWRYILVDEYQDTNAIQARLIELLSGPEKNIMVVGDDSQSIYRFRGAQFKNIFDFPHRFPGTKLVKLEQNYRSTQAILDLTNQIISKASNCYDKRLFTKLGQGTIPELLRPRDERRQSQLIIKRIHSLLDKGEFLNQIAIIMRASNDSYNLEVELTTEGLTYIKYGGKRFLETAHIKDVLAHLRVAMNPCDSIAWHRLFMLLPGVGIKKAQQAVALILAKPYISANQALISLPTSFYSFQFKNLLDLMKLLCQPKIIPLKKMEAVLDYYEPICRNSYEDYPRRLRDLSDLPNLVREYNTMSDFISDVVLNISEIQPNKLSNNCLTLSTIHSAKGLEWAHVFVIWVCDGRMPVFPALNNTEALEEERRLMYVACTRAKKTLTLCAPREHYNRTQGTIYTRLSRFLDNLPHDLVTENIYYTTSNSNIDSYMKN